MAEANPSLNSKNRNLQNSIEILENNARQLKQEINDRVDSLIASIDSQRKELLNQIDIELKIARESLKNYEKNIIISLLSMPSQLYQTRSFFLIDLSLLHYCLIFQYRKNQN